MSKQQKKQRKPLSIPVYFAIYVAVIAVCIALDQITKHYVEIAVMNSTDLLHSSKCIRIFPNSYWLTLVWTTNTGATGSMFANLSWRNWLFFIMTILGLPVFGWLLWRSRTRSAWGQVAYSFVIGGTIGNAIDRVIFAENGFFTGSVRDFVRVEGFFGIFNVADSFLVVGVIMALLAIVFFDSDSLLMTFLKERNAKLAQESNGETTVATTEDTATTEIELQGEDSQSTDNSTTQQSDMEHTDENH